MTKIEKAEQIAIEQTGSPYIYAARGGFCTPSARKEANSKYGKEYPNIAAKCQIISKGAESCDGCKYHGKRMFDCRGFTYWVLKQVGVTITGVGATSQWNTTKNWDEMGEISQMPKNKMCCVFKRNGSKMSHTGLWLPSKQKIIHSSGDVGYAKFTKDWTHYAIPKGLYNGDELIDITIGGNTMATLKKGSKGDAVALLQTQLNGLGYNCGEIDGIFGTMTQVAVKGFQSDHGLKVDGIAGAETQTKLAEAFGTVEDKAQDQAQSDMVTITIPRSVAEQLRSAIDAAL